MRIDLSELLRRLANAEVEFIVVGGAAAVLHGAPITTQDLDIVPRQTVENARRLKALLDELDAHVRELANRRLPVTETALRGDGHVLLNTNLGPLDCLGTLVDGLNYERLRESTVWIEDGDISFRVVDLPTLIEIKTKTNRAKDRLMLPVLLALQEEK